MTTTMSYTRPAEALDALVRAVRAAKGDDPLTPVTVIVPTNAAGVTARRYLGRAGGVAAIDMATPYRLAELIAGPSLQAEHRNPVSTPLVELAIRAVLHDAPGSFATVADHPSTVAALRELHGELRVAGPDALGVLAQSSARGREAARVSSLATRRLARDWYDEADLLVRASELVTTASFDRLRNVVVFYPQMVRGSSLRFLSAVGETSDTTWLLPHIGNAEVDAEMLDLGGSLTGTAAQAPNDTFVSRPRAVTRVVSTTDADDEVRHAVRALLDRARRGIPFARMAVVWPTDRPYARLVEHHLDRASIPWNGRPGTLVTERLVPRFLLDLLTLDRRGVRRRDLFDLLADIAVRDDDGRVVPVARWERLARSAGVTRGEHWGPRLAQFANATRERARRSPAAADSAHRDADEAEQLAAFVAALQRDLGPTEARRPWSEWASWCERQIEWRLGDRLLGRLDEAERLAHEHTSRVLDRLRHLDAVSEPVTRGEFRDVFAAEFEVAPGRLGRIGDGVTVGSLTGAVGVDADFVAILGAADGLLPAAPPSDPLLGDSERRAAGLATSDDRARRAERSFVSILQSVGSVEIGVPRGDLRATTQRLPSRWVARYAAGSERFDVSSHHAGLATCKFPAASADHRLRGRMAVAASDRSALIHACDHDRAAHRGLRLRAARRSGTLTEYDGDLSSRTVEHFARPVSPSQLERWAHCPHAYFVQYVLGVRPIDDPADELALSPMERGNVVHETLDRFNHVVLSGELPQPGPHGWGDDHLGRLLALYDEVADEFEATGRTGRPAHWHLDRQSVRRELVEWFARDGVTAAERGAQIISSEVRFGYDGDVALPLADGRSIAVRGAVDRIDRCTDGTLIVMDHKTGSDYNFKNISADDPTQSGTKFQLPAYAAAAATMFADPDTDVVAEYDFFAKVRYQRRGYTVDAAVREVVASDLADLVAGIEAGLFPATPGPPKYEFRISCQFCDPDLLGSAERFGEWQAKYLDPRLSRWFPPDEAP